MSRVIVCECGTVVRGESDEQLLEAGRAHMRSNHPAIAAEISDEDLLALSQEEPQAQHSGT